MAEEVKATGAAAPVVPNEELKNLKAEMNRKLENLEKSQKDLLAALKSPPPAVKKSVATQEKEMKDIWFEDPDLATKMIQDSTMRRFDERLAAANEAQVKTNSTLQSLYKEYPELSDMENPLTKKSVEVFEKMTAEEKANPVAYRAAVREAADELDIRPKSKRKQSDDGDNFSLSSSSARGGRDENSGGGASRNKRLDPRTVEFAKLLGLDMDDQKTVDRVKARIRDSWSTYKS